MSTHVLSLTDNVSRWLAEHIGADSISIIKSANTVRVVMRFGDRYCSFETDVQPYRHIHVEVAKAALVIRDEFFLLGMHSIPEEEGKRLTDYS